MPGTRPTTLSVILCLALLLRSLPTLAGGPLLVDRSSGIPYTWQVPLEGPPAAFFNVEAGPFNSGIDNAAALDAVRAAFATWEAIPTSAITYTDTGPLLDLGRATDGCGSGLPITVDRSNIQCVLSALSDPAQRPLVDSQSPIIFDNDSILPYLGLPPSVLAIAGIEIFRSSVRAIREGFAIFDGSAVEPDGSISWEAFQGVIVHEIGHFSNLGHTNVNGQAYLFDDQSGPSPLDAHGTPPADSIETMYPFFSSEFGSFLTSPHSDDIGTLSFLYPVGDPLPSVTGNVLDIDGATGISGVNVIARNPEDPFHDAVSALSGDLTQEEGPLGGADGRYELRGLAVGTDYVVYIDEIQEGGFSTPPRVPLPGPEEYFSGASESADPLVDEPSVADLVAADAASAIDIILNNPDFNEPDDDPANAVPIDCPFESGLRRIDPAGDVDFYAVTVEAGEVLEVDIDASTLGSDLDSLVGIFDSTPTLLAVDDDASGPGEGFAERDSHLVFTIPSAGVHYIAVSAYDDGDFDGGADALSTGPYSLNLQCTTPTHFWVDNSQDLVDDDPGDGVCAAADGSCTLRAAVQEGNELPGLDYVWLPTGLYRLSIPMAEPDSAASGDLDILDHLEIAGVGPFNTVIDGTSAHRILEQMLGTELSLSGLTLQNGVASPDGYGGALALIGKTEVSDAFIIGNTAANAGGGIVVFSGSLRLSNVTLGDNEAQRGGGLAGFFSLGKGIGNLISDSVIVGNSASDAGGGIQSNGTVEIIGSSIVDNSAAFGGGINKYGTLRLVDSGVARNVATVSGGGIRSESGATTLVNTTVLANRATTGLGGGIADDVGCFFSSAVNLHGSTVVSNRAGWRGGGLWTQPSCFSGSRVTIEGSILAHNLAADEGADCSGDVASGGFNLIADPSDCAFVAEPTDLLAVDPLLGPPMDSGHPGQIFRSPLPGSPAIDAGGSPLCTPTDQLGNPRNDGLGDGRVICDIGAIEHQPPLGGCGHHDALQLHDWTITDSTELVACRTISAGPDVVIDQSPVVVFTAGETIALDDGFSVVDADSFSAIIDPALAAGG